MTDDGEGSPRLIDFHKNPTYEKRLVAFYDFLGWRAHIARAGSNADELGNLRRLILRQSRIVRQRSELLDIKVSTFSDNIAISQPVGPKNQALLRQLAIFQIGASVKGFLLRGGVTIGDIVHDDEVVFGPGLNRAYELESQVAQVPRIIIDEPILSKVNPGGLIVRSDDGLSFLDPFTSAFIDTLRGTEGNPNHELLGEVPMSRGSLKRYNNEQLLRYMLEALKVQIRSPLGDKEWSKVAWLFDRIATRLGLPPASSYPRVLPLEM